MPRRLEKQILYGTFYLVCFIGIAFWAYYAFIKPAPTCFDAIQNQGEQGIDCGGPCAKICLPPDLKPIALVGQILILQPDADHQSLLALIANPNVGYSARSFFYSFSLLDATGATVLTFEGPSSLYAGESKYILAPNFSSVAFSTAKFRAAEAEWVPLAESKGPPEFGIVNAKTSVRGGAVVVEGYIQNKTSAVIPRVRVVGIIPGEFGQIAAASQTEVFNIAQGELKSFSIVHPYVEKLDLGATRVYPYEERL